MNLATVRPQGFPIPSVLARFRRPSAILGLIILVALFSFEVFNYSTTEFALKDLLGNLQFAGVGWATILSIAFCGIDFAGIARLFTPEQGRDEPKEVWYLFGAWFLAATMNAFLTWWGVAMAIASHTLQSTIVMDQKTLMTIVPVFVAMMVWVIRILIIGTISIAGERMIWGEARNQRSSEIRRSPVVTPTATVQAQPSNPTHTRPILPRPITHSASSNRPEPTYHNMANTPRPVVRPYGHDQNDIAQ